MMLVNLGLHVPIDAACELAFFFLSSSMLTTDVISVLSTVI
jgi:hypothetical protein